MFLPENIDLAQSEKYILSIRLTPDGFSFCIFSPTDKSIFYYHPTIFSQNLSMFENIKRTFFEVNFFAHTFRETLVTVVSPELTTMPELFFERSRSKDIFEFNIHGKSGRVLNDRIDEGSLRVLYDIDEEVYSFLSRNLLNPTFRSFEAHLLPFFARYRTESDRKRCFVDFHDEMVTVICFSSRQLLSVNTFESKDCYDALHNIVSIWEKHPLEQNRDWLFLSGNLSDNKESVDTLKKLIKNVEEIKFAPETTIAENNINIPTDILIQLSLR